MAESLLDGLGSPLAPDCFAEIARRVLDDVELHAGDLRLVVRELEIYLHGPAHADPFAHRAEVQLAPDRFYFHRAGAGYRGGSFKGVDLTCGALPDVYGGVLLRTATAGGEVVNGPSLLVDRLLAATGFDHVADLDAAIAGRSMWDPSSPLHLHRAAREPLPVYRTARVGLSLKRAAEHPTMPDYIDRPYRFLNAPRAIKKGRDLLVRALGAAGRDPAEIRALTGSPLPAIERWLAEPCQ